MSDQRWRAIAPSNIALIKYMGKVEGGGNVPTNNSVSFTIDHLITVVVISPTDSSEDRWEPLMEEGLEPLILSEKAVGRFLKHFAFLKNQFHIRGHYLVRSANNFPADCGVASSASSFAALTKATHQLALDMSLERSAVEALTVTDLSSLSRQGSGSSCRSFFSPWGLWRGEKAEELKLPIGNLFHQIVLLETEKKSVSSSEAHKRVVTSELFSGRAERANKRLAKLLESMNAQNWREGFDLVWAEFWDMHALFATSQPPFRYMNAKSLKVLEVVEECWRDHNDGPWVTMDAGANVHLLYRADQRKLARRLSDEFLSFGRLIESPALRGEG